MDRHWLVSGSVRSCWRSWCLTASSSLNNPLEIWLRAFNTQSSQIFPVKGLHNDSSTALEPASTTNLELRAIRAGIMTINVPVDNKMTPHMGTRYVVQASLGGSHWLAPDRTLSDPQWRYLTEGRRLSCNFGASASKTLLSDAFMPLCCSPNRLPGSKDPSRARRRYN
jgi:hypothetical protein